MLKTNRTKTFNFENAIYGARNPMNSWARYDSHTDEQGNFVLGDNDRDLALRLIHAGTDHRKFVRQIFICVDITAPMYWWKEFDTYKVGTVANSTSTMHKVASKPFELDDFSHDHMTPATEKFMQTVVNELERIRLRYLATKDKQDWYDLIQLLPSSYNQTRTVTLNYENAMSMYRARKDHKLGEWHTFCDWILTLPYMKEFIDAASGK